MDQKIRTKSSVISGIIVLILGIIMLPIAIGLSLSKGDSVATSLGIVFLVSCILLIYGGIATIIKSKKELKHSNELQKRVNEKLATTNLNYNTISENKIDFNSSIEEESVMKFESEILANWTFNKSEWLQFITWEKKERRLNTFFESFWILLLGAICIIIFRGASFLIAASISLSIGIIYWIIKIKFTSKPFKNIREENKIVITNVAVIINDSYQPFRNEDYWLGQIKIFEKENLNILEIQYHWNTRKGSTYDEIRVPIPYNKKAEAELVKQKLLNPSSL